MSEDRFADVRADAIVRFHDRALERDAGVESTVPDSEPWSGIASNHRSNRLLWHEEDLARRSDVPASEIVANKRAIDRYNQARNDAVERIDEALLGRIADIAPATDAWQNSETAGAIVDRMSILSLKVHHMRLQTQRSDASASHRTLCAERLDRLVRQRDDLARCYDALLSAAQRGRAFWRVHRQFKMYNDPATNPYLTGGRSGL
jgi:hypothetical protein